MNGRRDLLPPVVFRTLWSNIEAMIVEGHVRAVDVVKDELSKRDDDASRWANNKTGYSCRWKPTTQEQRYYGRDTAEHRLTSQGCRGAHLQIGGHWRGSCLTPPLHLLGRLWRG
ncbi:MAG: DUF4411 family protein [Pseudonocardiaceae bacterium]